MAFLALKGLALVNLLLDLPAKAERVRDIWRFIGEFPEWLNYHKQLDEKVKTLTRKRNNLSALEWDIKTELQHAELQYGKKRKQEVKNWLRCVRSKKNDVASVKRQIRRGRLLSRPWLERRVDKNIQEVDELCDQGKFPEGLLLDAHITTRDPFPTSKLVGRISTTIIHRISEWLDGDEVSRIGVHGVKGVGKTAIMMHIHNQILESSSTFEHVYWITASQYSNIRDLQGAMAKQLGIDFLNEEDIMKRAAKLLGALQRSTKKSVLIVDDILKPLKPVEIGIPDQAGACKVILSTQTSRMCHMMYCQKTIEVQPLSCEEAATLFKETVHLRNDPVPVFEETIQKIVKEYKFLPYFIIDVAQRLRGVHDSNEWMNALTEAIEFNKGLTDY